ncbi:MAG: response regulator, partial [Boseongicola sp. SB0677_bin_26]|nr:response regulator [Boseongicola sp. SB0677_bin_26]
MLFRRFFGWTRPFSCGTGLRGAPRITGAHGAPGKRQENREGEPLARRNPQNPEVEALRARVSALSEAALRISAGLDVDTVLRDTVESARALTGARFGLIATVDEAGRPQEFLTSGLSPEDARQAAAWPDASRLFEHLRSLDGPLRLADLGDHVRALGLAPGLIPCRTFQAAPMRHRGLNVGNLFLGEKEGGEAFTDEDEEVLVLFAAQATIAIANARTHREERRARARLEALVDSSPVGVVEFEAATGDPLSVNREAGRIVKSLLGPDGSLDELREALTARLADGREVGLDDLKDAETLRAVEVELSVPDGRRLRVLVNATPIRPGDGGIESVVVTFQDLAALEELERLRMEFLAMVSHELREPLAAIRGSAVTLLEEADEIDAAEAREFHRVIVEQAGHMRRLVGDLLDAGRIEAGALSVSPEPLDILGLVERARATFLGAGGRKAMTVDLAPDLPPVMADGRRIVQVLGNLFANAARHAPDASPIHVGAVRQGIEVAVSVADEGGGIPTERLPHLFRRHSHASDHGRGAAGFGLGLVICKGLVEAHGGRIRAESAGPGLGARFTFTLPVAAGAGAVPAVGDSADGMRPPGNGHAPVPVLVVDDDPETLRLVRDALEGAGYAPVVTGDPEEVPTLVRKDRPQLVLLDLALPGADGVELMETVPELADLPVIFISAYGRDEAVARALDKGAADYVVKPFSATELTARVRAALRRRNGAEPFVLGDLAIDHELRRVTVAGREVPLTPKEYGLLSALALNAGRVMTYASLLRQVWGNGADGDTAPVRDFVKKLRRKLGDDPADPAWIVNER